MAFYVAPYGNDYNAGTSPAAPFATLSKAASVMADGDICYVAPGTYHESLDLGSGGSRKVLTFFGDREGALFSGVTPGPVVLDGSDDGITPTRSVGITVGSNRGIVWKNIDILRFASTAIRLGNTGTGSGPVEVVNAQIDVPTGVVVEPTANGVSVNFVDCMINAARGIYSATAYTAVSVRFEKCKITTFNKLLENVASPTVTINSCVLRGPVGDYLFNLGGVSSIVIKNSIIIRSLIANINYGGQSVSVIDSVVVGAGGNQYVLDCNQNLYTFAELKRCLFAENGGGIRIYSGGYPRAVVSDCAFLDQPNPTNGTSLNESNRWPTITDGNGNVLLPDFTPVGPNLVWTEEENPIDGLRSARIEVPRVAYTTFRVAVDGARRIQLKAKKSHPTGTQVKFRIDHDPATVVGLADTDDVQVVTLGPCADRGVRFVLLEVWCQQVDFIDGHYLLLDSIQVI